MANQPTQHEAPATSRKPAAARRLTRDALVASICGFVVVLFFAVTLVKGPGVLVRPL